MAGQADSEHVVRYGRIHQFAVRQPLVEILRVHGRPDRVSEAGTAGTDDEAEEAAGICGRGFAWSTPATSSGRLLFGGRSYDEGDSASAARIVTRCPAPAKTLEPCNKRVTRSSRLRDRATL
jgi:hypothetical protein